MKQLLLAVLFAIPFAAGAQTKEQVIGCWVMKTRAGESLQLNRDGSFSFNDYNNSTKNFENLYGNWEQNLNRLTLMYADRPKQVFTISKAKSGWMLKKVGGFLFTKATPSDCSAAD